MSDEELRKLAERLRDYNLDGTGSVRVDVDCDAAASAILSLMEDRNRLTEDRNRLTEERDRLTDPRQIVGGGFVQLTDYDAMEARATIAEARLGRAVEALREIDGLLTNMQPKLVTDGEVVDRLRVLGQFYRICQTAADHLTRLAKERDECLNASADYLIDLTDVKARADRLAGLVKEATARVRDIENIALTSVGPGYRAIHQIVGGLLENLKEPTNE